MATFRVNKTKDYTIMSNYHLKDKNLSLKAKGLLSLMLSLTDEWNYSVEGLVSISKENETAINSALKELKENGYIEVIKLMPNETESGRIEYIYDIYENKKQEGKKQDLENLPLENMGLVSNNIYNNNTNIYNNTMYNNNTNNKELNTNNKILTIKEKNKNKKESDTDIKDIFDIWNEQKIITHRELYPRLVDEIKKALKKYDKDEIIKGIKHYGEAFNSKYKYCNYKWNLILFLNQKNALQEFFDDGSKWNNYLEWKNATKEEYDTSYEKLRGVGYIE